MAKIDWTKPIQTVDGREARVLCTDRKCPESKRSNMVLVNQNGTECSLAIDDLGYCGASVPLIINTPEKRTMWINFGKEEVSTAIFKFDTKEIADRHAGQNRIACVEVEYTVGEGLE